MIDQADRQVRQIEVQAGLFEEQPQLGHAGLLRLLAFKISVAHGLSQQAAADHPEALAVGGIFRQSQPRRQLARKQRSEGIHAVFHLSVNFGGQAQHQPAVAPSREENRGVGSAVLGDVAQRLELEWNAERIQPLRDQAQKARRTLRLDVPINAQQGLEVLERGRDFGMDDVEAGLRVSIFLR